MTVTASFQPARITSSPGEPAALLLRLSNDTADHEVVKLKPQGELAMVTDLQSDTIHLDAGEVFEVPVLVDVASALPAGPHSSAVEISLGSGRSSSAEATIDVLEAPAYDAVLAPPRSSSGTTGRHRITLVNLGNSPMLVELFGAPIDGAAEVDVGTPTVALDAGAEATVDIRVRPPARFWKGSTVDHEFVVQATGSDGRVADLYGTYRQTPRMPPWLLPALLGALLALLIWALLWFWLIRPAVEDIADDAANEAVAANRAVLAELIRQLEEAAAEAAELPLGTPADLRLEATAAPGATSSESFGVSSGRVLSVTDVVFQNPTGAVGTVSLLRNGEILLQSELANFRDLDFHFVAPFEFDGGSTVAIELICDAPGPGESECFVGTTLLGFVDEAS
ncbi:MAG: hypothetical protein QNM02_12445 [Acidimicrobiia bacterium]|nr:hypothetical protein [Acidimicrobiia bacterium]